MHAGKLKDNQTKDVKVSYLKKNLRRKLMTYLTGFNYPKVNRLNVVYPETLEVEDLTHKYVQVQKEFDAVIKCNEKEEALLKSAEILRRG